MLTSAHRDFPDNRKNRQTKHPHRNITKQSQKAQTENHTLVIGKTFVFYICFTYFVQSQNLDINVSTHFAFWKKCVFLQTLSADKRSPRFSRKSQKNRQTSPKPQNKISIWQYEKHECFADVLRYLYKVKTGISIFHPFCILRKVRFLKNAKCWQALTAIFRKSHKSKITKTITKLINTKNSQFGDMKNTNVFTDVFRNLYKVKTGISICSPILHFWKSAFFFENDKCCQALAAIFHKITKQNRIHHKHNTNHKNHKHHTNYKNKITNKNTKTVKQNTLVFLHVFYVICTKSKPGYQLFHPFCILKKVRFWKTLSADKRSPRFSRKSQNKNKSQTKTPESQTSQKSQFGNRKNTNVFAYVLRNLYKVKTWISIVPPILHFVRSAFFFENAKCWQALTAIFQKSH